MKSEARELTSADVRLDDVRLDLGAVRLAGDLWIPAAASGVVLFAHGSGSSRFSQRNQFVAATFREARLGTLLFDLLTAEEEAVDAETRSLRFDIPLLVDRLVAATRWLIGRPEASHLGIGLFGASTGGAAALVAAAELGDVVAAVVSRGGRPDLAGAALASVRAPTLLIVGGYDEMVIDLNEQALARLTCVKQLRLVPGATHLFEEPGKLEEVARLSTRWFVRYLRPADLSCRDNLIE
ncbi:MAG: dienelactone hydrolase family protein [Verrucomicrobiales bacterium]